MDIVNATDGASLSYAIVTPARDEERNIRRLAACLIVQTQTPVAWVVVDNGSTDGTRRAIAELATEFPWIHLASSRGATLERGAPIVRAFHAGLALLGRYPDVVVKLDADVTVPADHFAELLLEFARDPSLGVAGGAGYEEQEDGSWRRRHGTGPAVWGACRAYRRECLEVILPLEEHMGWDTLDLMKARMKGWRVEVFERLPFRHHRIEGERDGRRLKTYTLQGHGSYFMGYRFSYLALRTLFRVRRNPAAVGLLLGYIQAWLRRRPRCSDTELRSYIRRQQGIRQLPSRAREARRPRTTLAEREPG